MTFSGNHVWAPSTEEIETIASAHVPSSIVDLQRVHNASRLHQWRSSADMDALSMSSTPCLPTAMRFTWEDTTLAHQPSPLDFQRAFDAFVAAQLIRHPPNLHAPPMSTRSSPLANNAAMPPQWNARVSPSPPRLRSQGSSHPSDMGEIANIVAAGAERRVPLGNYVCHRCGVPGHFIQDCLQKISDGRRGYNGDRRSYGEFRCPNCKHEWADAECYAHPRRECRKCHTKDIEPTKMYSLEEAEKAGKIGIRLI